MPRPAATRSEHRRRFGTLPCEHRRDAGLQDTGLLRRDRFEGVAQIDFVIEIDGSDHGQHRLHHVGRVQAAAQADFDHGGFHAQLAKQPESHGGDGFEVGRVAIEIERLRGFVHDVEGALKLLVAKRRCPSI